MQEKINHFKVGDKVIHRAYGPGKVIQVDEKELSGECVQYYVVEVKDVTLWVPIDGEEAPDLRYPTSEQKLERTLKLLNAPADPLSTNRMERKTQLKERLEDGSLESICRVIRDLRCYQQDNRMNDHDTATLNRTIYFLLTEWSMACSIPLDQAEQQLEEVFGECLT